MKQIKNGFCYKIKCNGHVGKDNQHHTCHKSYIGETGRADGDKKPPPIKEHISAFKTAQKQQQNIEADRNITY